MTASCETELLPPWFPEHRDGLITPLAQAKLYPYPAPDVDYWMRDGLPELCPNGIDGHELEGRTAVLSVGSNRAPLQLRRKFGPDASLPVTTCRLIDCDIVFAATLSFYCASPATACPSPGTVVDLNIAWLDDDQLLTMHETEALGIAYDYIRLGDGMVDHGQRERHPVFDGPVFGYQSREPLLDLGQGIVAHAPIPSTGRVFHAMNEEDVLSALKTHVGFEEGLDDWIIQMREDKPYRFSVMARIDGLSTPCPPTSWTPLDAKAIRPDDFL